MKNKKILSRILALCSVVVLLFALSLPCFADEQPTTETPVYGIRQVEFTDFDSMFTWLKSNYQKVTSVSFINFSDGATYTASNLIYYYDSVAEYFFIGTSVVNTDTLGETLYFTVSLVQSLDSDGVTILIGGFTNSEPVADATIPESSWAEYGLHFIVSYTEELDIDGSSTPIRSGLFGQLYYILSDAIYGENVVLDGTQDFALTLVTTLLVFCVVLLPVLLVVAIMFKLFRW